MANAFLNATEYANTMLLLVKNQLVMGRLVTSEFENQVTDENGLTINVKRPPRFVAKSGAALSKQDIVTGRTTLEVDQYKHVHIGVGDLEYVQSYNQLMQSQTMQSAASALAHDVDLFLHTKLLDFNNWVGTPGLALSSPTQFTPVATRLHNLAVPLDNRCAVMLPESVEGVSNALIATNIQGNNRVALERSRVPLLSDIDVYMTQNSTSLTTGTRTNGTVDGASQNVNYRDVKNDMTQTIALAGLGNAGTVKKGDVFTIAGVFAVNPRSAQTLNYLQQFTIVEDETADGTGDATVTITPPIIVVGSGSGTDVDVNTAFATASAAPANAAVVTWLGTADTAYPIQAAFHKSSVSMVFAQLQRPFTGVASFATDPETGISIRYWRGSDITTGEHIHRWDMVYGAKVVDNQRGARYNGTA